LDKTGTLTLGVPQVTAIETANGVNEEDLLQTAAIAEQHSEHPLGEAIVRRARERKLPLREYSGLRYLPGKGISCMEGGGEILIGTKSFLEESGIAISTHSSNDSAPEKRGSVTVVCVARAGRFLGTITLADQLRAEAKTAVAELHRRGYRTILLTGDADTAAKSVGQELGVQESLGGLLPEHKLEKIQELLRQGRKVAMLGDGVNDAPALAEATVGIAMGQGTDVALETADVTLMTSDLSRLVEVLTISKRCYRVIMFNFWGTITVDTIGIVLAFFGQLSPIVAALIHVGSELAFILNSARLFRHQN
jgi:Cd2+/Zn2+-exporting ATPase/Cu+-exporting ATPase